MQKKYMYMFWRSFIWYTKHTYNFEVALLWLFNIRVGTGIISRLGRLGDYDVLIGCDE